VVVFGVVVFGVEFCSFSFVLVRFGSFFARFRSFWVRFGFVFFSFFWTIVIVSAYHIQCYSQSALLEIGFVSHN
jgi:hypothetical protein